MTLACFHKTKLHTTLLSLFLMFAFFSHAKIVGTPPYKSIDIPVSEVSSHFDMVIDMDNSLFISYEDGVKVFNGSQWQNLDFSKGNGIRRLLVDNDRVYLGGHQTIGYIEKDVFGQYNFTNMTPKNQEFESIWDIIKCNDHIYFRSVFNLFEFNAKQNNIKSWKFDSKLGALLCHNNQLTMQDRSVGFKKLINNQWQDSELQVPNNPFVTELVLIDENTYFVLTRINEWQLLKNYAITPLKFESQLPSLGNYVAIAGLSNGKLVLGSNNGLLTFVDTHTQSTESFQLSNEWIAKILVTKNNEIVVLTEFEVFFLQWPSPLRIQNHNSGLSSSLYHVNQWNNNTYVMSSAGVYLEDKNQDVDQHKLFKKLNWTNHEAWWLQTLDENTALLAESHQLLSINKDNTTQPISDVIYPRELIQSKSNPNLVYVITEFDVRTFINDNEGNWQSQVIYDQRPISLIEVESNEVLLSTKKDGLLKIKLNQQGKNKLAINLNKQLGISIDEENFFSLTQFLDGSIYAYKSNEIYLLNDNKLVKDSLYGLDEIIETESLVGLKQDHLGKHYAITSTNIYYQDSQNSWNGISLSPYIKGSIYDFYFIDDEIKITSYGTLINYLNTPIIDSAKQEFQLTLKSIEFSSDLDQNFLPLNTNEPIVYDQGSGDLSFNYAFNDLKNHKETQYRYRLIGQNDKWSDYSHLSKINLNDLTANDYILEVQAKNLDQVYSSKPYQIIINPPWYLTKISIALWVLIGILLLLLLLHFILKWRERIHEVQKIELKKIINHKTHELKRANKMLLKIAHHDGLTGLSNRVYLDEFIKVCVVSDVNSLSVLMLDMDHFKKYNDKHGHLAGDELLKKLALILTKEIEEDDETVVARYGGEEFIVILLNKSLNYVKKKAEKVRLAIQNKQKNISVSIGISFSTDKVELTSINGVYQLIDSADQHLYKAKNNGRNQICSE